MQWRRRLLASVVKHNINQAIVRNYLGFKNVAQERKKLALAFVSHTAYKHGPQGALKLQLAPAAMLFLFGIITLLPRETQDLE